MTHRVGTVCYATEQGIGYLPKWFYDAGVITDVAIFQHHKRENHYEWYPSNTLRLAGRPFNGPQLDWFLSTLDAIVFFETPFDWSFLDYCKHRKVRTVLVPMYECYPQHPTHKPDAFINPSKLDQDLFGGPFLQIPVPPDIEWRKITQAKRFLHNGGNLGLRGHKGTLEVCQAMQHVKEDITLTIRAQDTDGLKAILARCPWIMKDERITVDGPVPRKYLFDNHDVFIMAEKYNGLSVPLLEAYASGMLVITSDRYPINTWLPRWPLIDVKSYSRQRVSGAFMEYDEALVTPENIARKIDEVALVGRTSPETIEAYNSTCKVFRQEASWSSLRRAWVATILGKEI